MAEDGALSHRTYKAVAEALVGCSANARSPVPSDLHMTVREIYKTCYPGFGAATGSGAYAPGLQAGGQSHIPQQHTRAPPWYHAPYATPVRGGLQAGGSSTKASTSGSMLGKGLATMHSKVEDENMRKRLDTRHEFLAFVKH